MATSMLCPLLATAGACVSTLTMTMSRSTSDPAWCTRRLAIDGRLWIPAQKDNFALLVLTAGTGSVLVPGTAIHGDLSFD